MKKSLWSYIGLIIILTFAGGTLMGGQVAYLRRFKKNITESYSIPEKITIPLEKGTNKIYFSVRDKIQQKRLRKLDIIKIK